MPEGKWRCISAFPRTGEKNHMVALMHWNGPGPGAAYWHEQRGWVDSLIDEPLQLHHWTHWCPLPHQMDWEAPDA